MMMMMMVIKEGSKHPALFDTNRVNLRLLRGSEFQVGIDEGERFWRNAGVLGRANSSAKASNIQGPANAQLASACTPPGTGSSLLPRQPLPSMVPQIIVKCYLFGADICQSRSCPLQPHRSPRPSPMTALQTLGGGDYLLQPQGSLSGQKGPSFFNLVFPIPPLFQDSSSGLAPINH